jgi:hypothetical protein
MLISKASAIAYEVLKYSYNFLWDICLLLWKLKRERQGELITNNKYSIGIVTYVDRYDLFFKFLIKCISTIFPDTEIVIAINGYFDKDVQRKYLNDINQYLSTFKNVKIVEFVDPQSLSKLWNLLLINSSTPNILILNDDVKVLPWFRKSLESTGVLNEEIGLINQSWSHFYISKLLVKRIGWFDERFPGVGNEDEDYECRLVLKDIIAKSFAVKGLKNVVYLTENFSYGNAHQVINKKYIKANKDFFNKKWHFSSAYEPSSKFVRILDGYVALKQDMDTPNFYEFILLDYTHNKIIK